jgi:hypothetical protein
MRCQKGPQIALGNSDDTDDAMRDEQFFIDPPPDRAGAHTEAFRHLGD